jgi:hypothetical protein
MGLAPLGIPPMSALADWSGVPLAVSVLGALLVAIVAGVALPRRGRQLE